MKTFRIILICVEIALIIVVLFTIDYRDFMSRPNLSSFLGIIGALMMICVLILSNRYDDREDKRRYESIGRQ